MKNAAHKSIYDEYDKFIHLVKAHHTGLLPPIMGNQQLT